jgi:hypothetical protein
MVMYGYRWDNFIEAYIGNDQFTSFIHCFFLIHSGFWLKMFRILNFIILPLFFKNNLYYYVKVYTSFAKR